MGRKESGCLPPQSHILTLGEVGQEAIAGTGIAPPGPPKLCHGHAVRDGWWGQGAPPSPGHCSRVVTNVLQIRLCGARNNREQRQMQEERWGLPWPQTQAQAHKSPTMSTSSSPSTGQAFPPTHESRNGIKIKDAKECDQCRIKDKHLC